MDVSNDATWSNSPSAEPPRICSGLCIYVVEIHELSEERHISADVTIRTTHLSQPPSILPVMPPLPLSLTVAYLSSRMENDDEFVSFPHMSRFSERAKLAQCRSGTFSVHVHVVLISPSLPLPAPPSLRYTIGQMRTCACWPSALCGRTAF